MKLGIDARVLMDKNYSGVSEYAANLLEAILEIDQENEYCLFYNNPKPQEERLSQWQRRNSRIAGSHYPNKIFNYLLQRLFFWPKLDLFMGSADLVFAPHFNFISVSRRAPLIVTVHDLSFLRYPEFFSQRKNFWHRSLNVQGLLKRAALVVAVSENTKNDLIELLGLPPERVKVIYSGLNRGVSLDDQEADAQLQKLNLKPGFILFVGNIEPRKNIAGLIGAYEELRRRYPSLSRQLVLAGAKGWKYRKIFAAWKNSPYRDDIIFLGYVSAAEKAALYRRASLFVYPSFYEGFGFPPLEALRAGLPVVSSNVSSLPEVLGKAALLVNPFRQSEIAEAMHLALTDKPLRQRLISLGREQVEKFSWAKTAQEYIRIFSEYHAEEK